MHMQVKAWLTAAVVALAGAAIPAQAPQITPRKSALIDSQTLLDDLRTLSADDMEGRVVDTPGGAKARQYVLKRFAESGLAKIGGSYEMPFTFTGRGAATERHGVNVVGHIAGTDRASTRHIVVSAHYDHIAPRNGQVSNGADDNASGTAALFAIAKHFSSTRPANTLIFAAFDAEESGVRGSAAFVARPPVPMDRIVINVNMDMIGRDPDDKLFAVGVRANPFLRPYIEAVAAKAPVKLIIGHDTPGGRRNTADEDWSNDSDHASFQRAKIPAIYLGVEDFAQHHQPTDDYETMSHDFYVRAVETCIAVIKEFDRHLAAIQKARAGGL